MLNHRVLERFPRADTIREAGIEDLDACSRMQCMMLAELDGTDITPELIEEAVADIHSLMLDSTAAVLLLERDGQPIGQASIRLIAGKPSDSDPSLEVAGLYVDPRHRLPGTSLSLIRTIIDLAGRVGATRIRFLADTDRLAEFYTLLGCTLEARVFALEVV